MFEEYGCTASSAQKIAAWSILLTVSLAVTALVAAQLLDTIDTGTLRSMAEGVAIALPVMLFFVLFDAGMVFLAYGEITGQEKNKDVSAQAKNSGAKRITAKNSGARRIAAKSALQDRANKTIMNHGVVVQGTAGDRREYICTVSDTWSA
ncbi:MAG: hypothetical protein IJQ12_04850 [Lachnospiraceae bacterium]|nr:hypothetical protein [Lachnospiraceae bacterium]